MSAPIGSQAASPRYGGPHQTQQAHPTNPHANAPHAHQQHRQQTVGSNPFLSSEQAAAIQTTLQQIERQMRLNVKHMSDKHHHEEDTKTSISVEKETPVIMTASYLIYTLCMLPFCCFVLFSSSLLSDESLHTPYAPDAARGEYHAILSLLATLEQQTLPISSIGYDPHILAGFASNPPASADSIVRFTHELAHQNGQLKGDSTIMQSSIIQMAHQAKGAAREFKAANEKMKQGSITQQPNATQPDAQQQGAPITQAAMQAAQMHLQQQQQPIPQRTR